MPEELDRWYVFQPTHVPWPFATREVLVVISGR
ncbi:hypothetical protein Pogu_1900 [Pyrobaculum oguniense TE7]|uniref:Uncharacterized protein n=1 Tax=Pyrobaculum oguniense (strain DSM 13380 / JCM 10595 / TE7) TaxID=698757 RepID=H6QB04_PYROT|nr:hypothetical protein Pogu_1900 [Pyrobaculum oguniense TE7]